MSGSQPTTGFKRTLPLFDEADRDFIQRLLHHAVADFAYDHPDRKVARDIYHGIREGEAIRLFIAPDIDPVTLVISPSHAGVDASVIIDRFIAEMDGRELEWQRIADDLDDWHRNTAADDGALQVGFEYLH